MRVLRFSGRVDIANFAFRAELQFQLAAWIAELQDPIFVPKGTRLILTFHFDDGPNNRADMIPIELFARGEPSHEEMMSGWIDYIEGTAGEHCPRQR